MDYVIVLLMAIVVVGMFGYGAIEQRKENEAYTKGYEDAMNDMAEFDLYTK